TVSRTAGNDIVFVMAPEQAVAANLMTENLVYPILASSALAKGTVIAIAMPGLVSAYAPVPELSATREPELVMDTAPVDVGTASQQTVSLFQTDKIALKMRMPLAWALRAPSAIAFMTGVNW